MDERQPNCPRATSQRLAAPRFSLIFSPLPAASSVVLRGGNLSSNETETEELATPTQRQNAQQMQSLQRHHVAYSLDIAQHNQHIENSL